MTGHRRWQQERGDDDADGAEDASDSKEIKLWLI